MTMTRRHFEAIAGRIQNELRWNPGQKWMLFALANNLATDFEQFNPAFNRLRFLTACGFTAEELSRP